MFFVSGISLLHQKDHDDAQINASDRFARAPTRPQAIWSHKEVGLSGKAQAGIGRLVILVTDSS